MKTLDKRQIEFLHQESFIQGAKDGIEFWLPKDHTQEKTVNSFLKKIRNGYSSKGGMVNTALSNSFDLVDVFKEAYWCGMEGSFLWAIKNGLEQTKKEVTIRLEKLKKENGDCIETQILSVLKGVGLEITHH